MVLAFNNTVEPRPTGTVAAFDKADDLTCHLLVHVRVL